MIAEKNTDVKVQSNLPDDFQAITMGIAEDATAHIISLLTDLYGDRIAAFIREYATNAKDAQIEAGISRPIEISLPTHLAMVYTVKDYGIGLGREEIRAIYSQYGASTKRGTNDQNGMLGLGCKSALTYTNQFTVVSVKAGIRTTVVVSRTDDDVPTMTVVDESPTSDPSGTEVQIPIKREDMRTVEQKARKFFSYWTPGDVLVNGEQPERISGLPIGDSMLLVQEHDAHAVVMGDVAYPADFGNLGIPYGTSLVAWVPMGAVRFAPSRENLMTTSTTRATLAQVAHRFKADSVLAIQAEVDKATSHAEALKTVVKWCKLIPGVSRESITYKGAKVPTLFESTGDIVVAPGDAYKMSQHHRAKYINAEVFDSTIFVYNYDRASFTAGQKKKLTAWVNQSYCVPNAEGVIPQRPRNFALIKDKPTSPYIPQANTVDWAIISAIKIPRTQYGSSGRIPGSYDFFEGTTFRAGVEADEIDTSYPVYYFIGRAREGRYYAECLATDSPDFTIVVLGQNRVDKFKRNFPKAKMVQDAIGGLFDKWAKTLTQDQRLAMAVRQSYGAITLGRLDSARVDDPAIKEAIRLTNVDLAPVEKAQQVFRNVNTQGSVSLPTFVNPLDRYPLLGGLGYSAWRNNMDHIYLYLNAAYAATQKP